MADETTVDAWDVDEWIDEQAIDESKRLTFEAAGKTFSFQPAADMQVIFDIQAKAETNWKAAKNGAYPAPWKPWIPGKKTIMTMATFVAAPQFALQVQVGGKWLPAGIDIARALKMGKTCGEKLAEIAMPLMQQSVGEDEDGKPVAAYADALAGEEEVLEEAKNG